MRIICIKFLSENDSHKILGGLTKNEQYKPRKFKFYLDKSGSLETYEAFVKKFAIAEGWKYFERIGWYCHSIIFLDGSIFILSNGSSADGHLEHFTEAPEVF